MDVVTKHKQVLIGSTVALVVGLLLGFGIGRQTAGTAGTIATNDQMTSTSTEKTTVGGDLIGAPTNKQIQGTVANGNSVTVNNQAAGMSVKVSSVSLSQEGWVAIRDSQGDTLGAALFAPGTHTDVSVPLLKSTEADGSYQALIYFDDGTKTFSLKTETIVLNPDGSVAGATFIAQ